MTTSEDGSPKPADQSPEDDVRAKFRAALAQKHGTTGANAKPHAPGTSATPASNDKRTRQFRRKSGG
jgi:hypothetical protein